MNIKLYSHYDHFPNHKPVPYDAHIEMYNDEFVYQAPVGSCALLIEPRSIQPKAYEWMEQNCKRFKYVFTHDSRLLQICDNAKLIIWGFGNGNYMCNSNVIKTKNVSMVCSDKTMCQEHKDRIELARMLKDCPYVDVMGTVDGGPWVETEQIYPEYKFSIAIENYIDDYWFTEKILNCFANKTIPIYYGARKIGEYFNEIGIIRVNTLKEIESFFLKSDYSEFVEYIVSLYDNFFLQEVIEDNFNRVQKYGRFEDWFYKEYGKLLEDC